MRNLPIAVAVLALAASPLLSDTLPLESLDVSHVEQGWGRPRKNKSVDNHPLTIAGQKFAHGLGTHAVSHLRLSVNGATHFTARVGVDDEVTSDEASVDFQLVGDGKVLADSGVMRKGTPAKEIDADLAGVKKLDLRVTDAGDGISFDHADWADAAFTYAGDAPAPFSLPKVEPYILTPKPGPEPRINGARIFGVRPGHPVLFTIPATGDRPMTFSADNLPDGVRLDEQTGRLTGSVAKAGEYPVTFHAKNDKGESTAAFKLVVGDKIALTPPMGWNSWNCWAHAVSDEKVRASADAMVSSGLIDHGWSYVNIDDCWEVKPSTPNDPVLGGPARNPDGSIRTNKKFPDMKALADYVHARGLKIGLYSSPGPLTCGGYTASYQHELDDAQQYAKWGFDYLKYDWCSYGQIANQLRKQTPRPSDLAIYQKPYLVMHDALLKQDRDIVFSLCQYGMGDVWKWGADVGGNCWRTTGDITDTWGSLSSIGFSQDGHEKYAGPGHWNDPDMLIVGHVGWGPALHPTRLNPDEQYTHISLWCLLSSPLLIGCDMTQLDPFTLSLLTNDEVLAVNQDPLGKPAGRVARSGPDGAYQVWARPLEDGSQAVGLFNTDDEPARITADFNSLHLTGAQTPRDLWRQQDLPTATDHVTASVPPHGVVLLRLTPAH